MKLNIQHNFSRCKGTSEKIYIYLYVRTISNPDILPTISSNETQFILATPKLVNGCINTWNILHQILADILECNGCKEAIPCSDYMVYLQSYRYPQWFICLDLSLSVKQLLINECMGSIDMQKKSKRHYCYWYLKLLHKLSFKGHFFTFLLSFVLIKIKKLAVLQTFYCWPFNLLFC